MTKASNGRRRGRRSAGEGPTADRLVALAAQQFRSKGFHATTTRELSAALGIEKSSLYYHVASKDDLLHRICVESLNRIHAAVEAAVAGVGDALERIHAMINAHVGAMLDDRDLHATMLVELRALSGDHLDEVIVLRDRYEGLVRQTLTEAQEAGVLTTEFSPHELTLALLNLLNWTIFWYSPQGVDTPERISALFRSIFLDGVTVRAGAAAAS